MEIQQKTGHNLLSLGVTAEFSIDEIVGAITSQNPSLSLSSSPSSSSSSSSSSVLLKPMNHSEQGTDVCEAEVLGFQIPCQNLTGRVSNPCILLTGVFSDFGVSVLCSLLEGENTRNVVCLLSENEASRWENEIHNIIPMDRDQSQVTTLTADLTKKFLGLSGEDWEWWTKKIDEIIHTASNGSWLGSYAALKPINVDRTREMI